MTFKKFLTESELLLEADDGLAIWKKKDGKSYWEYYGEHNKFGDKTRTANRKVPKTLDQDIAEFYNSLRENPVDWRYQVHFKLDNKDRTKLEINKEDIGSLEEFKKNLVEIKYDLSPIKKPKTVANALVGVVISLKDLPQKDRWKDKFIDYKHTPDFRFSIFNIERKAEGGVKLQDRDWNTWKKGTWVLTIFDANSKK